MSEKRYFPEMNNLRGIAILMVLLFHSIIVYPVNLTEIPWCDALHNFLWMVEMPLFFFVSGFCFQYHDTYGVYLKKKTLRILVPHVVFGICDMTVRILPGSMVNEKVDISELFKEFFLYAANDWFLWSLYLIFLIAPMLWRMMKRGIGAKRSLGKAGVIAIALFVYFMQDKVPEILMLRNVAVFLIYFVIGMCMREGRAAQLRWKGALVPFTFAAGCVGIAMLQWSGWTTGHEAFPQVLFVKILGNTLLKLLYQSVNLLTVLLLCYAWIWLARKLITGRGTARINSFLNWCSRYSMQMYLLNGYALVITRTLLVRFAGLTEPGVIIPVNFVLDTLIVLLISALLLDRWNWLRLLCGIPVTGRRK